MLLATPDLVLALDVNKILAGDARILERLYIVGDVHRSEHVVGVVDKPGEMLTRPCGRPICQFSILQYKPLLFCSGIFPLCPYLQGFSPLSPL